MAVNVVCAGAGWVTRERHLPSLKRDPRVRVVGVVDVHPERAEALARDFEVPQHGTSFDEDWTTGIDAVTVGTPPPAHPELVHAAIERGWHCLCEKPLALTGDEAAALVEAADRAGMILAVVHNFQFARSAQRLFDLIDRGELGVVEAVYGFQLSNPERRLPHWYRELPGGLFVDEAVHLLYLLRRMLGRLEPRAVDARVEGIAIRDITATFEHETIWASLSMSFRASVSEWQLVVVGSRATAAFDIFRDVLVVLRNDGKHGAKEVLRTSASLVGGHLAGVATSGARRVGRRLLYGNDEVVRRFVDAVAEGRRDRLAGMTGEDGLAIVRSLEDLLARAGLELARS